mmetsp:Transcript_74436/g.187562  ORF Transcript_74436/g.187562 Transcript_74436/m.187562 type:complete len:237 (+) Transcript_74436:347-1057(+)
MLRILRRLTRQIVLGALKVREHVTSVPTLAPELGLPRVVVGGTASLVEQHVERGGPTEDLPAAQVDAASGCSLLVGRVEVPVVLAAEEPQHARRDLYELRVVVRPSGLQDQDLLTLPKPICCRKSIRQHATCSAAADDDVVPLHARRGGRLRGAGAAREAEAAAEDDRGHGEQRAQGAEGGEGQGLRVEASLRHRHHANHHCADENNVAPASAAHLGKRRARTALVPPKAAATTRN